MNEQWILPTRSPSVPGQRCLQVACPRAPDAEVVERAARVRVRTLSPQREVLLLDKERVLKGSRRLQTPLYFCSPTGKERPMRTHTWASPF